MGWGGWGGGFFFFNDTATTEIYTLSLHDALPISELSSVQCQSCPVSSVRVVQCPVSELSPLVNGVVAMLILREKYLFTDSVRVQAQNQMELLHFVINR